MVKMIVIVLLLCTASHVASGAFVGSLIKNRLSLQLDGKHQELQLDVNAQISSIKCSPVKSRLGVSVTLNRTDGSNPTGPATIPNVKFMCGKHSVAALGRGDLSLPAQITPKKKMFTYCLSPSTSNIFFGAQEINFMPNKRRISPLLQYTPLLPPAQHSSYSYLIQLNALTFNGTRLPVKPSTIAISSTEPYTRLVRPAYVALRAAFRRLTIQRVPPVAPFDTCFNASGFSSTRVGISVPAVELQLGGNSSWTLFGANTMVLLNADSVACVAFLDAGPQPALSVIGKFQQLDNLIQFDVEKRRFGFTGILYFFQTTCSNFNSTRA